WLVTDDGNGPTQIVEDELRQTLCEHAQRRGLSLILPLHVLEDRLALSARELWYMDEAEMQLASVRYFANDILVRCYSHNTTGTSANASRACTAARHDIDPAVAGFGRPLRAVRTRVVVHG